MNNSLRPKIIEQYFRENLASKEEVYSMFSILIENCDSECSRAKFIEIFVKIAPKNKKNFKLLENCVISDESPFVRSSAAQHLLREYPKLSLNPLRYVIRNDCSIMVLKTLIKFLDDPNHQFLYELKKELINKLAKSYQIVPKESKFLLELENLINRNSDINFYKPIIHKNHINGLNLAGFELKEIPDSIGCLSHLQYLNLWDNNLTRLPKSIETLSKLKYLFLDWNRFSVFPDLRWNNLKALEKLSFINNFQLSEFPESLFLFIKQNLIKKYLHKGVNSNDAIVLGLLEILTGMKLRDLTNTKLPRLYACGYKVNLEGFIIGIYLYGYYNFQINLIPVQLCRLKYLEELILRDQSIQIIPECFKKLKLLKHLDLSRNNIKSIPECFKELGALASLDLRANKIEKVPKSLNQSKLKIWL